MTFFIIFFIILLAAVFYIGWHIDKLLPLNKILRVAILVLYTLSFLCLFTIFGGILDKLPMGLATFCYEVGCSFLIAALYLLMIFLLIDIAHLFGIIHRSFYSSNWLTLIGIIVIVGGLLFYGNYHYNDKKRVELTLKTEKTIGPNKKLVLVSDLHLGYHNRRAELSRWIDLLNAEHADMILVAGDIIDSSIRPLKEENMAEEFRRLNAPIYACLGNHEYFCGSKEAQRFYEDAGITLLSDTVVSIDSTLTIVGRDDRTNKHRRALAEIMEGVEKTPYTILIEHQPYHLEEAESNDIDFQFSGHTHRGQVWPISWITDALYECSWGSWQRGGTQYYVSSGLGLWGGKFRIGTQSEYVVATLHH